MVKNETRKPVILSADDDQDAHLLLERAFVKSGCPVVLTHACGGAEVIDYLLGEAQYSNRDIFPLPDLLLLDLKMPKVSGFDVLEYLRNQPRLPKFPTVVFSSSGHEEDVKKAYALGCSYYVVKPVNFEKLVDFAGDIATRVVAQQQTPQNNRKPNLSIFDSTVSQTNIQPLPKPKPTSRKVRPAIDTLEIYRLLVEQVKDYAIFMLDTEGFVLSWNEGARRINGYEAKEIIGKHFSTFYPPLDVETEKPRFELRMAQEMGRYEEEGWRIRKDGSQFWANVVVTPLRCDDGKLKGFAKVTRDLSQAKIQEESFQRLLDSEERFRLLVEQVKDYGIFMLDAKGNISSWNQGARRINGYSSDEIIGKHFSIFYTPDAKSDDHPSRELNLAIRDGRYEEEGWRVRKDGTQFWASVVITALWDKRGHLNGFAKVTRDLTQRKLEQDALRRKTETLEDFAHTLSHDLRAPLRSIASFAEILISDANELSEANRTLYLEKILKSSKSMDILLKDILKLSQLSLAPAPEQTVSLNDVMEETLCLLDVDIQKAKAQVSIKQPMPKVYANRTLLVQIFSNLISNAVKFAPKGQIPKIEIYAENRNGSSEIHVKDHGSGIPEEFHKTVFNVFERGTAQPDTSGTGIGLAIVKKAAERVGGSVSLKSREGKGSDFIVTLHRELSSLPAYLRC